MFVAAGGAEDGSAPGGVFAVKNGSAVKVPGSPKTVFGVVWHRGTLYVSALDRILAWSKWNGKKFRSSRVVYKAQRKHFSGFTGLAYRKGRLYTGGSFGTKEFKRLKSRPYDQTYLSLKTSGKGGLKIIARGLRQPWQSTFVKGHKRPYLTVLAQDNIEPLAAGLHREPEARPGLRLPEVQPGGGGGVQGLRQALHHVHEPRLPDGDRRDRPASVRRPVRRTRAGSGRGQSQRQRRSRPRPS